MATTARSRSTTSSFTDRVERVGCFAIGTYALALFFAAGAFISLINRDIATSFQGGILAGISLAAGIWLARRRVKR